MHAPLTFESISIAFCLALAAAAPWAPLPHGRWRRTTWLLLGLGAAIAVAAYALPAGARLWLGHAYLVAGYRLPALLVHADVCRGAFESWLMRTDARWFPFRPPLPAWAAHVLELSYLFCYLLVPAAFVFVWMRADVTEVDRFWTAVLLAGFACYGLLPWLASRPPRTWSARSVETTIGLRRLNLFILDRASHGFNTFPSGHVAVSMAAALVLLESSTSAGLAAIVMVVAIAVGAVAGRYHYAIDVMTGACVGAAAWLLT